MSRATRPKWDRYQTRCAILAGGWQHHRILPGWIRATTTQHASHHRNRILDAISKMTCPYYTNGATCTSGCWDEPGCITEEPRDGWASEPWGFKTGATTDAR